MVFRNGSENYNGPEITDLFTILADVRKFWGKALEVGTDINLYTVY